MGLIPDKALARLCSKTAEITIIFSLSTVALVFTLASIFLFDLRGSSRVVAYLNVPGLLFMVAWTSYVLYLCRDDMPYGRGEPKPEK